LQLSIIIPSMEHVEIVPLIEDLLATLRDQFAGVAAKVIVKPDNLSILRNLSLCLLPQYVDNAAKDCVAGSPLILRAAGRDAGVEFRVHNRGPAIPPADFERIFDRFDRCTIAKLTAQTQGRHVSVTNDADKGSTFYASVPTLPSAGGRP